MKKRLVILFMLVLLSTQFVSAIEFDVQPTYSQGETLIAKLSGNFVSSVTRDNVFFYRGHVRSAMDYDIAKINSDYYIYALLEDKIPANYSISIEDVEYMVGKSVVDDAISRNFTITEKIADFSLDPGFIVADSSFSLEVQNLQADSITINVDTISNDSDAREIFVGAKNTFTKSYTLKSGEIKKIDFLLGKGNVSFHTIKLYTEGETITEEGSCFFWQNCTNVTTIFGTVYEIPVYISQAASEDNDYALAFEPSEMTFVYLINNRIERTVYLYNQQNDYVRNITFHLSESLVPYINVSIDYINNMEPNTNLPINLSIFSYLETQELQGTLEARANNNISTDMLFIISFTNNETEVVENKSSATKTCAELNGTVCNTKEETCSTESIYAIDNVCCLGTCAKKKKSSIGIIIAVLILALITGGLAWFYFKKYKKPRRPIDLLKISKGKSTSSLPPKF